MYYISRLNGLFPLWSSVSGFMVGQTGRIQRSFSHCFHYVSESHRCLTVCPSFFSLWLCFLYLLSLSLYFSPFLSGEESAFWVCPCWELTWGREKHFLPLFLTTYLLRNHCSSSSMSKKAEGRDGGLGGTGGLLMVGAFWTCEPLIEKCPALMLFSHAKQ